MKAKVIVNLEKMARSTGADRYQGMLDGKMWQVYIPQSITRTGVGRAIKEFTVTIESKEG